MKRLPPTLADCTSLDPDDASPSAKPHTVFTQFQGVGANDVDQFRDGSHQPIR
jgi:hypothetical protein